MYLVLPIDIYLLRLDALDCPAHSEDHLVASPLPDDAHPDGPLICAEARGYAHRRESGKRCGYCEHVLDVRCEVVVVVSWTAGGFCQGGSCTDSGRMEEHVYAFGVSGDPGRREDVSGAEDAVEVAADVRSHALCLEEVVVEGAVCVSDYFLLRVGYADLLCGERVRAKKDAFLDLWAKAGRAAVGVDMCGLDFVGTWGRVYPKSYEKVVSISGRLYD